METYQIQTDHGLKNVCRVDPSFFDQTFLKIRKDPIFSEAFKSVVTDINKIEDGSGVIFSDEKRGFSISFKSWRPFRHLSAADRAVAFEGRLFESIKFYRFDTPDKIVFLDTRHSLSDVDKKQTVSVLWKIVDKEKMQDSVEMTPEDRMNATFKTKYQRDMLPGETFRGYRIPLFQPTEKDDGTAVLLGNVFGNGSKFEKDYILKGHEISTPLFTTNIKNVQHLSRDEFYKRAVNRSKTAFQKIVEVETYFNQKLSDKAIDIFFQKTQELTIQKSVEPVSGKEMLFATQNSKGVYVLADKPTKENFDRFLGRLVTEKIPGERYNPKRVKSDDLER